MLSTFSCSSFLWKDIVGAIFGLKVAVTNASRLGGGGAE